MGVSHRGKSQGVMGGSHGGVIGGNHRGVMCRNHGQKSQVEATGGSNGWGIRKIATNVEWKNSVQVLHNT